MIDPCGICLLVPVVLTFDSDLSLINSKKARLHCSIYGSSSIQTRQHVDVHGDLHPLYTSTSSVSNISPAREREREREIIALLHWLLGLLAGLFG